MAKRKTLPKKIRFEVFKRDKFTCQYCGKQAPDVKLEIDHIKPVSKGGDNSIINLITSCFDCNRGKGKRKLDDSSTVKKQKKQLDDIQERREIIEMMNEWRNELMQEIEVEVDLIEKLIVSITNFGINENGRFDIRRLLKKFGYELVFEATEIAFYKYFKGDSKTRNYAFDKIGGICYNKTHNIGADKYGY